MTDNASTAIKGLTSQTATPDESGLRISAPDDGNELALTVVTGPTEGDQVVAAGGAQVFVDARASTLLDDKVLDAEADPQGAVQFLLAPQA